MRLFRKSSKNLWANKSKLEKYRALQYAVISDDMKEIEKRVKEGIDINTTEENGDGNILMYYILNADKRKYDHQAYTRLLIKLGSNVNHQRNESMKKASALSYAVQKNNLVITKTLLENKANIEVKDENGNTPLWKAVMDYRGEKERLEIIKFLINKGADLDAENNFGHNPRNLILDRHERISPGGAMENHPTAKSWDLIELLQ